MRKFSFRDPLTMGNQLHIIRYMSRSSETWHNSQYEIKDKRKQTIALVVALVLVAAASTGFWLTRASVSQPESPREQPPISGQVNPELPPNVPVATPLYTVK